MPPSNDLGTAMATFVATAPLEAGRVVVAAALTEETARAKATTIGLMEACMMILFAKELKAERYGL